MPIISLTSPYQRLFLFCFCFLLNNKDYVQDLNNHCFHAELKIAQWC